MNTKQSQKFPNLQIVELFDEESQRDEKYVFLQDYCEWIDPYESSVLFYFTEENYKQIQTNKSMIFWLLEGAQE